jgi:hypothetical protein
MSIPSTTLQMLRPRFSKPAQLTRQLGHTNPTDEKCQSQTYSPHDPIPFVIVCTIESEHQIENDTAQVARSTRQTRDDSVIRRENMRNNSKVRTVTGFSEDCNNGKSSN